ncbi:MAG TPA: 23S rRNA (adenine(2030)-N(6))-methyltransferase RlmJ [Gaiellaceae bacterium]|jgi:23S rRNA (adenine2030-N6)-methyltransferase
MNRYYGNIGDVWKHLALAELLALEPPKRYWETHAGSASYPLTHSPDRDYGVYRFIERAGSVFELAESRYAAELRRLAADGGAPANFPGSALLAMRMLGQAAEYLLCDLDPDSVASLSAAAAELGLSEKEVVREADGMTTVVEEARKLKDEAKDIVVTIDPFQPFEIAGGISALELAAGLIEDDFKVLYWYGYDTPEQRTYPMGVLREYAREAGTSVWCGDLMLVAAAGQSEQEVEQLLAGAEGPGAGCGVVCGNFSEASLERCARLGEAVAKAWEDARLPNGSPGALEFLAL